MTIDLDNAKLRLYEDSSLTDDLIDESAGVILKWAEVQLQFLAEKHASDPSPDAFEADYETLRRVMKGVGRLTVRGSDYSKEQFRERMGKVIEWAQSIGLPVDLNALDGFLEQRESLDEVGQVRGFVEVLAPTQSSADAQAELPTGAEATDPVIPAPSWPSSPDGTGLSDDDGQGDDDGYLT